MISWAPMLGKDFPERESVERFSLAISIMQLILKVECSSRVSAGRPRSVFWLSTRAPRPHRQQTRLPYALPTDRHRS